MCAGARRLSCCCCLWCRWCSGRRRARPPARLGGLISFGAAPRSPPVPSGPSGALHTGGAWCFDVWLGLSAHCSSRLRRRPPALRPGPSATLLVLCLALACRIVEPAPNFARNSLKTLSNREIRSLEFQRSGALLKVQAIELPATFLAAWSYALSCRMQLLQGVSWREA